MKKKAESRIWTLSMAIAACAAVACMSVQALEFNIPAYGDNTIDGVLNTTVTVGGAWRMHAPSADLIGKADLNPDVCGRGPDGKPLWQSCQGLFRDQAITADHLYKAPGQFTMNADDGNLNYGRGRPTSGIAKVTQDISLKMGDFGFFGKALYFYDWVNNNFTENHPNTITKDNYLQVGAVSTLATDSLPRNDSRPCGARNPMPGSPCGIVYGKGAQVYSKRRQPETLKEIGTDLQFLDYFFYGKLPLPFEKQLTFKIGSQGVNWGESTLLAFGSINTVNSINANNFYRIGGQVEEIFRPSNLIFLSTEPFEGATVEAYYQLEWIPLEAPAPGSYLSFLDLGPKNAGNNWANLSFGGAADDPDIDPNAYLSNQLDGAKRPSNGGFGRLQDNSLSGLTNTSLRGERLRDNEPNAKGQFGLALKYYASWLNNGTELGFYFENYHSRIPFVSVYSTVASCARPEGNSLGINPANTVQFFSACKNMPIEHALAGLAPPSTLPQPLIDNINQLNGLFQLAGLGTTVPVSNDPDGATDSAVPFDSLKLQLEYPKNIQMYGMSFNTTAGDLSLQGEVAFRPKDPLQVAVVDLAFAGFGPTLGLCHLAPGEAIPEASGGGTATGCQGTNRGVGLGNDGVANHQYGNSDFINNDGTPGGYKDTFDLLVGAGVGSGRSFPSFIIPYRGMQSGTNPGSDPTRPYDHNNPGYIRGWEYFKTFQFNLGGTYIMGATDNPIGADQIITLFETGATYVPGLPSLDKLQFEAAGIYTHASAGADGSGFVFTNDPSRHPGIQPDGSFQQCDATHPCKAVGSQQQACSTINDCSYGVDGLRFNPHQADPNSFPTKLSAGYDIIMLIRYESVLPGISFENRVIWKHDVYGTAPGLATNFIEGRKNGDLQIEMRYKSALAFDVGYTWFWGGGSQNLNRDRDQVRTFVKYQF